MPRPLSRTSYITCARAVWPLISILPGSPSRPYLRALSTRLENTCSTASRSLTTGGRSATATVAPCSVARCATVCAIDASSAFMSISSGLKSRRPSRESFRTALMRRSILVMEVLMKVIASSKPVPSGSVEAPPLLRASAWAAATPGCHLLENIAPQRFQFGGEAHDVHERRAQIVADDIGEALNLFVGFSQIGGAMGDAGARDGSSV